MQLGIWAIFFLFGAFQAILFGAGLWSKGRLTISKKLLLAMLGCIAIILTHHAVYTGIPEESYWKYFFIGFSAGAWLAVLPSYYLYVRSLLEDTFSWKQVYWLLYIVPIYHLVSWCWEKAGFYVGFYLLFENHWELYNHLWVASYLIMALTFGLLSWRVSRDIRQPELLWLKIGGQLFLLAVGIAIVVFAYLVWNDNYSEVFEFSLLLTYEAFVLMLAFRSIRGSANAVWLGRRLYGNTALSQQRLVKLDGELAKLMETEKPFIDSQLQLKQLADSLGANEQELSQLFSRHLNTNFYDYINQYRLKTFEQALLTDEARQLTIVALAEECGFKSKTSFYRVFREKHGITPSAYLKKQKALVQLNKKA